MTERQLVDFLITDHPGHIYPLLEKKWSWEVQDEYTRRKWSFRANVPVKQMESPFLDLTDIDIFCVNNVSPIESVALQVKKIKVRSTNTKDAVNKGVEADVKDAVNQADLLVRLGFPLVSTLFIIANDAHQTHKGGVLWDSLSGQKLDSIIKKLTDLHEIYCQSKCIGLYVLLFVESNNQSIKAQGAAGIKRVLDPAANTIAGDHFQKVLRI